ncbi:MAG: M4 family metallopeptidase [Chloroflexota bacterium]
MKRRPRSHPYGLLILLLALVLSLGLPVSAGAAPGGGPKSIDPALVKKLKDSARGSVTISINEATTFASFIVAGRNGDLLPSEKAQPQGKAKGFIKEFGGILGVADAADLVQVAVSTDKYGATHITYEQRYRGLPVFGGVVKAHVDAAGDLTAVNGTIVPAIDLATDPRLTAGQALARAIAAVVADPPIAITDAAAKVKPDTLHAESTELLVYRTGLVKGEVGTNELVYHIVVTNGANIRDAVFVHAMTGKVINRYTLVDNALYRQLYEISPTTTPVWEEGAAFPGTLNAEQQDLVTFSGNAYYHFFNAFGRDSYDALGARMRTVNNDPGINCPNANWNGTTTNYCTGVTSDDVVAHEWGHAYTEYTHGLIYQWQPGALNEAYSDIWGETVDLINGLGTDTPGGVRTVGACSMYTANPAVVINSPASIARTCEAGTATFGPAVDATGVTGDIVLVDDGVADPSTSNGCTAFVNAGAIAGKVALIDRGICGFADKVQNAQIAGAIGVVVADNVAGGVAGMGGSPTIPVPAITIPSLRITLDNGNAIKGELGSNTVNVTLKLAPDPSSEDSYRWLMGEDSTAFGGAIRDMWTPTCYGDPAKVSDVEYHCDPSDGGGVHSNSGVPNHGYALLVDGGTFNGVTVTGIGLVKAAHLYWRAESVYQMPTTNFADHADALQASCTDLIGAPLAGLSASSTPAGLSGESISALDCVEVIDMIAAVELRTDPTVQCDFQPLLGQNPPSLCANGKPATVSYRQDFEHGLAGWSLSNEGVFSGWTSTVAPIDWALDTTLPGGRAGAAAFAAGPDAGNCDGATGDISGVMRLESPPIAMPGSASLTKLTFDHYVATEAGWDGGNVKISINGGAFVIVPASAFIFNQYNATLETAGAGNTNPLAGEPGFTGTDGGEVHGSWGQSQIDLKALGLKAGDTFRIQFDFGRDGCGGNDGWYVDNVTIQYCNQKKKP